MDLEDGSFDWTSFYQAQFEEITADTVKQFSDKYKGTEEEKADLIKVYNKYKGNMNRVYETVLLSNVLDDDERFRGILDQAIAQGEIEGFDAYVNETEKSKEKRVKKAEREAEEAEEALKEMEDEKKTKKKGKTAKGKGNIDDLAALIQIKHKGSGGGSFLDALEAKYGGGTKKAKRAAPDEEPSEEAFQAARAKISSKPAKGTDNQSAEGTRRSKRSKA